MSKTGDWVLDMHQDADVMSRKEFIKKHARGYHMQELVGEIWDNHEAEKSCLPIPNPPIAQIKPEFLKIYSKRRQRK